MNTATKAVFNAWKFREEILSNLSFNDLSNALQVASSWHATPQGSRRLHQTLFPESAPAKTCRFWNRAEEQEYGPHITHSSTPEPGAKATARLHPRIARLVSQSGTRTNILFPPLGRILSWSRCSEHERVFLTQPPCKKISLYVNTPERPEPTSNVDTMIVVEDADGVRLASVIAALQEAELELAAELLGAVWFDQEDVNALVVVGVVHGYFI
ncbi:hypothetical protein LTR37_019042 [Vermiconidia calcicola]|uniref:Uncharacterized protein n=1 Tax=Vermiconidia calcicola TaxID=1690605 RepID=A0ACC3MGS8_9PEZI|nr:hypothetical protein LTR37_019042 [Vermiconidia calcicola]